MKPEQKIFILRLQNDAKRGMISNNKSLLVGAIPKLFTYYDFSFKVTERAKNNFCLLKE